MLFSRLFWKLFASFALLILLFAAGLVSVVSRGHESRLEEQTQRRVEDVVTLVHNLSEQAITEHGAESKLVRSLSEMAQRSRLRIELIRADGHRVGTQTSDAGPANLDQPRPAENTPIREQEADIAVSAPGVNPQQTEVVQAFKGKRASARRTDPKTGRLMFWVAERLQLQDGSWAVVRVGADLDEIQEHVTAVRQHIWLLAIGAVLAALLLMYLVVGRIIRPLATLTRTARDIARGRFAPAVHITNRDEIGELAGAFNVMSSQLADRIAELQRHQKQSDANSERLATVLAGMVDGVIAVDQAERVLFVNQAASRHFNIGQRKIIGRPLWEVVRHPHLQTLVRNELAGTPDQSQAVTELEFPRNNTVVALYASPLPGTPCPGVVLVLHDITELRRLENLRRDFVSNVSHELKTPLASIQAFTSTLLDGALEDENVNRTFLERIDEQSDRLHALIQDMLSLQKIETGHEAFEVGPVDIAGVVWQLVELHSPRAESQQVTVSVEGVQPAPQVLADTEALRTMLENLIDNAIKYTPAHGEVSVRWVTENGFAVVAVADTGVGIPRDQQERVFERFFRVDKARSREVGGTGLGLSIVKHLAQVFGGSVSLGSSPGRGSTFTLRLPLANQDAPAHSSSGMPFSS